MSQNKVARIHSKVEVTQCHVFSTICKHKQLEYISGVSLFVHIIQILQWMHTAASAGHRSMIWTNNVTLSFPRHHVLHRHHFSKTPCLCRRHLVKLWLVTSRQIQPPLIYMFINTQRYSPYSVHFISVKTKQIQQNQTCDMEGGS